MGMEGTEIGRSVWDASEMGNASDGRATYVCQLSAVNVAIWDFRSFGFSAASREMVIGRAI